MIARANYNPGMRPFEKPWGCRFEGELGAAGTVYEFNVKIQKIECDCPQDEWDDEVRLRVEEFERMIRRTYKGIGAIYFTGRSAGWLAIEDVDGRMTEDRLNAIDGRVRAALKQFKRDMVATYPRKD